jgi:hypothetical protein
LIFHSNLSPQEDSGCLRNSVNVKLYDALLPDSQTAIPQIEHFGRIRGFSDALMDGRNPASVSRLHLRFRDSGRVASGWLLGGRVRGHRPGPSTFERVKKSVSSELSFWGAVPAVPV